MIQIDYDYDSNLVVKIAETKEELEGAFQVLYRSYLEMGYCEKSESEMRLTIHHALPTTSVIIAKYKNKVVGTLTLVRNNNLKLPCEKEWNIDFLKTDDRRVAEITCLAIDKEFRRAKNGNIFFPVMKFMYEFSTQYFGTQTLAIVVHPKERCFYEGLMFFTPIDEKVVENYYGAPAMAFYLNFSGAKSVYSKAYNDKIKSKNLYHYFEEFTSKNLQMPKRNSYSVDYPVLNKNLFQYFYFEKSNLGASVDEQTLQKILMHYPSRKKSRVINRFSVDIQAKLLGSDFSEGYDVVIKNISTTGLRIVSADGQPLALQNYKNYEIQFTNHDKTFEMTISNQWLNHNTQAGFEVKTNQLNWYRFLKNISRNYAYAEDVEAVFSPDRIARAA